MNIPPENPFSITYLDATLETPEENLACDEALLEMCENGYDSDVLRFWEPTQHFVVLGNSGKLQSEVYESYCRENHIPILRRISGGGTVLQGPGCLNYSLILRIRNSGSLSTITGTNAFVMQRNKRAIQSLIGNDIRVEGHTDLAIGGMKFSGNAQKRRQHCLLFHGTFLLHFGIVLTHEVLKLPSRQPAYRNHRSHEQFMMNLGIEGHAVKDALRKSWKAERQMRDAPFDRIRDLVEERYSKKDWNYRH